MNDEYILKEFTKLVALLNETQGTNAKVEILRESSDLKPLIKRIWDPETKTHVTKKGLETWMKKKGDAITGNEIKENAKDLYTLFDELTSGVLSGDRAKSAIWVYINHHKQYEDIILRILEKNPRIRLGATMLLQAFPGLFRIFKVALAQEWTEEDFKKAFAIAERAWISKKIDGMRLICIIGKGKKTDTNPFGAKVKFYSRKGHEVTSLEKLHDDIVNEIVPWLEDEELEFGRVLDGEVVALDENGREDFKLTVSAARKKDVVMDNPRYKIFDFMSLAVFNGNIKSKPFSTRLSELQELMRMAKPKHCELLEQIPWSKSAFQEWSAEAKKQGWEGLMIRMDVPYEPKRSRNLLKYKFTCDGEYHVKDVVIEEMPFANKSGGEDSIIALNSVIIHHKGNAVNVGSGFDKSERLDFARHPEKILGKLITVKYQEEFQDEKTKKWSLRCPIYKGIVGDQERDV